jgi:hypothetical protein
MKKNRNFSHMKLCLGHEINFKCELARKELVTTGQSAIVSAYSWPFQVLVYIHQLE